MVVLSIMVTNEVGSDQEHVECQLRGADLTEDESFRMIRIKGLAPGWAEENEIESGVSTIFAQGSCIDDGSLFINTDEELIIVNSGKDSSKGDGNGSVRNLENVVKKVLVLRIVAKDSTTTATEAELADDLFGAAGDVVNLQSQFKACSYDQLQFNALASNTEVGTDGIYTVSLPNTTVVGQDDTSILVAAVNEAKAQLGDNLENIADHVMVCLPPGTKGGWIAYAYVNHWLSAYNDEWCRDPSGQMHEVGKLQFVISCSPRGKH